VAGIIFYEIAFNPAKFKESTDKIYLRLLTDPVSYLSKNFNVFPLHETEPARYKNRFQKSKQNLSSALLKKSTPLFTVENHRHFSLQKSTSC
jgi:hypothetical protein